MSDDMTVLVKLDPAFPMQDLFRICDLLKNEGSFVPGFTPAEVGLYDLRALIYSRYVDDTNVLIFPDRNLTSRIAQLAQGKDMTKDRWRASAVMALAQCLDMNFEPSICFHELASRAGNIAANEELRWFREADAPRPQEWVDLALGRTDRLKQLVTFAPADAYNLERPLNRWRRNYIVGLKIACLQLQKSSAQSKAQDLIDWMFNDFFMAGPGAMYGLHFFAPSAPRAGMFKQLFSADRDRAVAGIKNAAWDMTYLSDFTLRISKSTTNDRLILATADQALSTVADMLGCGDVSSYDHLVKKFSQWWSMRHAIEIATRYCNCIKSLREPARQNNRSVAPDFLDGLTSELEAAVLRWHP